MAMPESASAKKAAKRLDGDTRNSVDCGDGVGRKGGSRNAVGTTVVGVRAEKEANRPVDNAAMAPPPA